MPKLDLPPNFNSAIRPLLRRHGLFLIAASDTGHQRKLGFRFAVRREDSRTLLYCCRTADELETFLLGFRGGGV